MIKLEITTKFNKIQDNLVHQKYYQGLEFKIKINIYKKLQIENFKKVIN
jgi:hypothetical protein